MRYRASQQAVFECDEGYEIRAGNGKIICKEDGSWEPQGHKEFPQCKEKACQVCMSCLFSFQSIGNRPIHVVVSLNVSLNEYHQMLRYQPLYLISYSHSIFDKNHKYG